MAFAQEPNGMDPIWQQLPSDLAERVCNQLPKVRAIPENLKKEIVSQRWMLAKSYNWYLRFCQFHARPAYIMFQQELGVQRDINQAWMDMDCDARSEFYWNGPGSNMSKDLLEREEEFQEWKREADWDS